MGFFFLDKLWDNYDHVGNLTLEEPDLILGNNCNNLTWLSSGENTRP